MRSRFSRPRALLLTVLSTLSVVAGVVAVPVVLAGPSTAAPRLLGGVWTTIPTASLPATLDGLRRTVNPSDYTAYTLDLGSLASTLQAAPMEFTSGAPVTVSVPSPSGEVVRFAVAESPVMEAGLAARRPDIKTYAGKALGDVPASIRLDVTPMGFHAAVRGGGASWYVDPAYIGPDQGPDAPYLSYLTDDVPEPEKPMVEPEAIVAAGKGSGSITAEQAAREGAVAQRINEGAGKNVVARYYRLALSTDPTYTRYFYPGATADTTDEQYNVVVTAMKATLMNRVNQLYGDDMSLRMLLVNNTDLTNFNTDAEAYTAGGRCGALACYSQTDVANGCSSTLLTRNRQVLGQVIGAANFDIGHIGLGLNGGGLASLGVVGLANKAQGCTGIPTPTGDFYAVDYVAHEMGHEFAGNHTFDGTAVNCAASNRNAGTSVEPGSGITVMAYAGICATDNLQPHSDPYFSQRSQTEIGAHTTTTKANLNELQTVMLVGYDATDSFTLTYPGVGTTAKITNGTNYTAAGIKAAVEALFGTGYTVTVGNYFGGATFDTTGFQLTFTGATGAGKAIVNPVVDVVSGTFTGQGNDVTQGGPPTNKGISQVTSPNHVPSVTAPPARSIPVRTPFQLTGSGTDADGDTLLYLWEQNDIGLANGTPLETAERPAGALFRVFGKYAKVSAAGTIKYMSPGENLADTNPSRTFPDIDQIINGYTNAATGTCPAPDAPSPTSTPGSTGSPGVNTTTTAVSTPTVTGVPGSGSLTSLSDGPALECYSELLPTQAWVGNNRDMKLNFRLTARDLGNVNGDPDGGTSFADTVLTVVPTAGPFLLTSQPVATTVDGGSTGTVTWAVANTDTLAANVRITYSTDGGHTYPYTLVPTTANSGSATVKWPDVATTTGRVRVEAIDNYFFDINDAPITVRSDNTPAATATVTGSPAATSTVTQTVNPTVTSTATATSTTTTTVTPTATVSATTTAPTATTTSTTTITPSATVTATTTGATVTTTAATTTVTPTTTATATTTATETVTTTATAPAATETVTATTTPTETTTATTTAPAVTETATETATAPVVTATTTATITPTTTSTATTTGPAATETATETVTPTATVTATATAPAATETVTSTVTPTTTSTATTTGPAATETTTETVTPTVSATATATAPAVTSTTTETVTPTVVGTATTTGPAVTSTATETVTPTATATATATAPAATETITSTVTPTTTSTATTTAPATTSTTTETVTPTVSATATATAPAVTSTATTTVTPTVSATATVTASPTTTTTTTTFTPTATATTTATASPTATVTVAATVTPSSTATETSTVTATAPTVRVTATQTVTPTTTATATTTAPTSTVTITESPTTTVTASSTGAAPAPAQPTSTATAQPTAAATAAAAIRTHTRIRLPQVRQRRSGPAVKVYFQVVARQVSAGKAGKVTLRLDGRKKFTHAIPVTLKKGNEVLGSQYRLPKSLAVGRHSLRVSFKPDSRQFTRSVSRRIYVTVTGGRARAVIPRSRNAVDGA